MRPVAFNPGINRSGRYADDTTPFSDSKRLPVIRKHDVGSCVSGLLEPGRPVNVLRRPTLSAFFTLATLISSLVVDPVDGVVFRRAVTYSGMEQLKGSTDTNTDDDPSPTVVIEGTVIAIQAAITQVTPCSVFFRPARAVCPGGISNVPSHDFSMKASAAFRLSGAKGFRWDNLFVAALTSTEPPRTTAAVDGIELDNCKTAKYLADDVLSSYSSHAGILPERNQLSIRGVTMAAA